MYVSVEISYYPLIENYSAAIKAFILQLKKWNVTVDPGPMSTIISGEFQEIMDLLKVTLEPLMKKYSSVFTLKISNSCFVK